MKISFNPSTVAALTSPPDNKDITFDLKGHNIFARGVKFSGTDTQVNVIDNLISTDTSSALSANMGRYLNLIKTPYNNTKTPSSAPSAYNIEICPSSSGWYSSLGITDGGGGILIRGHTGTPFNLWLHDTSNVWYKQTNSGTWKKMDAGYADHAGYLDKKFTVFGVEYNGSEAKSVVPANFISQLDEGTSNVTDGTMFITSYASDSGFNDTNAVNVPYKRKASCLWNYIAGKADARYTRYYNNHDLNIDTFTDLNYIQTAAAQGGNWSGTSPSGSHNGKAVLNVHTHTGKYYSLLMLDTKLNRLWMRSANSTDTYGNWAQVAYVSDIPASLKNPYSLTIQTNGTTLGSYNGSSAVTWNITYSNVGAAAASHNHTSLSGVTRINFNSDASDSCYIGTTVNAPSTHLDFYLSDDASQESFRWIFADCNSAVGTKTIMELLPTNNANTALKLYDSYVATQSWTNGLYITSLGTSGSNLTWTKNGTTNNITVPFATYSSALTINLHLSSSDNTWYPIVWGGSSHNNTDNSTGQLYKSYDKLVWQTSSLTLYATMMQTNRLNVNGTLEVTSTSTFGDTIYLPSTGSSYIANGGNDASGADFNNANIVVRSWWGISFKSYDDVIRTYIDTRTGNVGTKGVIYATHFYEYSDRTLKKNIKSVKSIINIPKLREFDWKDTEEHSYGFIAQELEELGYGCLVSEVNGKKTVNYTAALTLTMAKLLNLINIQNKKISNLTKELKSLKYGRKKNSQ